MLVRLDTFVLMSKQATTSHNTNTVSIHHQRALFDPMSVDESNRTVEIVFATEAECPIYDYNFGRIMEVLVCSDDAGDLSRLNNGGALCDTHDTSSVKNVLGVVDRAWFDNGKGRAIVRFSKTPEVESIWQNVKDGIIRNVSVGYIVRAYNVQERNAQLPLYTAIKWEATEISLAVVQVDADSGIGRSATKDARYEVSINHISNSNTMSVKGKENLEQNKEEGKVVTPSIPVESGRSEQDTPPATPTTVTTTETLDAKQIASRERARISDIRKTAKVAGINDDKFVEDLIEKDITIDRARAMIIDRAAEDSQVQSRSHQSGVTITVDESDKRRRALTIGLALRSGLAETNFTPEELKGINEFRGRSLMDLSRMALVGTGMSERDVFSMDKMEMVGRSFTQSSSDFPVVLEGVLHRTLLANYKIQEDTWRKFCSVGSVSDFREYERLRMGSFGNLDEVKESGEYKEKTIDDAERQKASIGTKGNMVSITRKMIINDDLGAFTRIAADLGRAAARSIESDVYKLLLSNPAMADGKSLFHADHKNLLASAQLSTDTVSAIRLKIRQQMDPSGNDYLDLNPFVFLVSDVNKPQADIINESQYNVDVTNKFNVPNKSRGIFNTIVGTPRISDNSLFAFADPNIEPVIEVNFLDGNQTPFLENREGWKKDGVQWKIRLDYGVNAIGFRGAVKVPGS